jgi:glutathione S-transferase
LGSGGLTTCSKQVRLCLVEKGIAYTTRYIELWRHENLSPDYLKLNPSGVVPTLVHDGHAIHNSFVIMEYLEDVFPTPSLRPDDPLERAKMRLWTWTADDVHHAGIILTQLGMLSHPSESLTQDDIAKIYKVMPVPERRERWYKLVTGKLGQADIDAALAQMGYVLDRLEHDLGDSTWIAGETYSLADIAMLAIVHRVDELHPEMTSAANRPRVAAWQARMKARPTVAQVYRPGTPEAPSRPAHMSIEGIAGAA